MFTVTTTDGSRYSFELLENGADDRNDRLVVQHTPGSGDAAGTPNRPFRYDHGYTVMATDPEAATLAYLHAECHEVEATEAAYVEQYAQIVHPETGKLEVVQFVVLRQDDDFSVATATLYLEEFDHDSRAQRASARQLELAGDESVLVVYA